MKPSIYNYSTSLPDGTHLLFNFYTLALLALTPAEARRVTKIIQDPNKYHKNKTDGDLQELLFKKGFLLNEGINEMEILKAGYYRARADRKNLSLTILPSLACNFRCTYCYQKRYRQKMSREVEAAIIRLVQEHLQKGGSLSVSWFGGEPLLQMDIIERLSKTFIQICTDTEAKYSASIITNGYLLDKANAAKLTALKVDDAQVTLDGPPEIHDQRRIHQGGQKTFSRILDHVKQASQKLKISLRMNVDESNKGYIQDMIDILMHEGLGKKVGFYLGQTYPYTEICQDVTERCLMDKEFSLLGLRTLMRLVKDGFPYTYWMPASRGNFCTADQNSSFVITPSGGIVNCWNETAARGKEIGHLLKPCTKRMKENTKEWMRSDPFRREECVNCLLLPICLGGCPYLFQLTGKVDCHKWIHNLRESLAVYYYYKVAERERKIIHHIYEAAESVKKLKEMSTPEAN